MIDIRKATRNDTPAIADLMVSLGYPDAATHTEKRVAQLIAHPDEELLVAAKGGKIVGVISIHFIPQLALAGDFCRISYFCVSEDARGEGIGAALEARTVELARARGCDRIEVHSSTRRERAHRFYYRQGYVESPKYLIKSVRELLP